MAKLKMKKRTISKLIAGISIIGLSVSPLTAYAGDINDLDKSSGYAKSAIVSLAERNIISGDDNGNFFPKQVVTRERLVTMMVKAMNIDTSKIPASPTFKDVPSNHWAYRYIEAAFREGLIQKADNFGINQSCSREQMAAILVRALDLNKGMEQENMSFDSIKSYRDYDSISGWAKNFVDTAVKNQLMHGTSNNSFSPKEAATMEQSAVVIDRLIANAINKDYLSNGIKVAINGDYINMVHPIVENGEILIPDELLKYLQPFASYEYNKNTQIIWMETVQLGTSKRYAAGCAQIGSNVTYITHDMAIQDLPFDNKTYEKNKVVYNASPKIIDSKVYLPVGFVANILGADFKYEESKNTLFWADDKAPNNPSLLAAKRKKLNLQKDAFEYSMKADFYENIRGSELTYNYKTIGKMDFTKGREQGNFHLITDNKVNLYNFNTDQPEKYGSPEESEVTKVGTDLYTKNKVSGQYELTNREANNTPAREYDDSLRYLSSLSYFSQYRAIEVYRNTYLDGQKTTKYVLRLSDAGDIDYLFRYSDNGKPVGDTIVYEEFEPAPFPRVHESYFFGEHTLISDEVDDDSDNLPRYKNCSAKMEIYVNDKDEILKEVIYNQGNRYDYVDYAYRLERVKKDIDYSFVYEINFKPFSGTIEVPK